MRFEHRMRDVADANLDAIAFDLDDRNVLLFGRVNRVRVEFDHRFATARGVAAAFVQFDDEGRALRAFEEFSHFLFLLG